MNANRGGWRRFFCGLGLALALAGAAMVQPAAARPLRLDDLHRVREVSDPRLAPNGEWVAWVESFHNLSLDITQSRIFVARYDGTARRPLHPIDPQAVGESQRAPVWGVDGALYYLSDRGAEGEQVWRQPLGGGDAKALTAIKGGVDDFALSPDAKRLALILRDAEPDWPAKREGKTAPPFVTERFLFMEGDNGEWLDARRRHLHVMDLASGEIKQLLRGDHDEALPAFSPDGQWLVYASKRGADPDRHPDYNLYLIAADGRDIERQLTDFPGADSDPYWASRPQWSPDGGRVLFLRGGEPKYTQYAPPELAIVDVKSGAVAQPAKQDRGYYQPRWSADGRAVYALRELAEQVHLVRVDLASGQPRALSSGDQVDSGYDVGPGERLVRLGNDARSPAELFAAGADPAAPWRAMSQANDEWLKEVERQPVETLRFTSGDGVEIHALLTRPANLAPGKKAPLLLRLHGGPVWQFQHDFAFEQQWFVTQGYAVLAVNPRGSSGRGLDFARAIFGDWGHLDVKDALAAVDHVVGLGIVDPQRIVLGGHSYGSILTNYLIASDRRFKAAYSSAGGSNVLMLYGNDMYARDYELELGTPWANLSNYLRVSFPLFQADRIRTPTLFLCGAEDFNVPCGGTQQMYQALRSLGVPTRFVRFPDQGHGLTIPSYLEFRLRSYAEWFERHLGL